jgi:hypothetical protein
MKMFTVTERGGAEARRQEGPEFGFLRVSVPPRFVSVEGVPFQV